MRNFLSRLSQLTFAGLVAACLTAPALATVVPNFLFNNNAVLQRDKPIPVWGTASPGESVTVTFGGVSANAVADANGNWRVNLTARTANATGSNLVIQGTNTITYTNVVVGEVWIASGQSNMEMRMDQSYDAAIDIAGSARYPMIREVRPAYQTSETPLTTSSGAWQVASPTTTGSFSAIGYYYALTLYGNLNVPVGIIQLSRAGSHAGDWIDPTTLQNDSSIAGIPLTAPSRLYNGMIHPVTQYGIRGALWYEGEASLGSHDHYSKLFPAMIKGWRARFAQGDFPFNWVQLSNFGSPAGTDLAFLREAQTKTLSLTNTGQAISYDAGEAINNNPGRKLMVAQRLARIALARTYGKTIIDRGPIFNTAVREGTDIRVSFTLKDNQHRLVNFHNSNFVRGFELAGPDMVFKEAQALISSDLNTALVTSFEVPTPAFVRYGWRDATPGSLVNREGLPAVPFRSDGVLTFVAAPTFNPAGGTYTSNQNVTISSYTSGATIHYTTDGTEPTTSSPIANGPISVTTATTLKAKGFKSGLTDSEVASASYTIHTNPPPAAPTFSPTAGTYSSTQNVTISTATSGATIRYTIDGTEPTSSSPVASSPIPVAATTTLKAKAFLTNSPDSSLAKASYTIQGATQVRTELIVHEPFAYPIGSSSPKADAGLNEGRGVPATNRGGNPVDAGTGLRGDWGASVDIFHSLTYSQGTKTLNTSGGAARINLAAWGNQMYVYRSMTTDPFLFQRIGGSTSGNIGVSGTSLYVSLLARTGSAVADAFRLNFKYSTGDNFYLRNTATGWRLHDVDATGAPLALHTPTLLVLKFDFGATTNVSLWVNPALGQPLGTPNATKNGITFPGFGNFQTQPSVINAMTLDELRIGTTLESVTPYTDGTPIVTPTGLQSFRSSSGLPTNGSEDLSTPGKDGVANLLKYALNMVGNGIGQRPSLSLPNTSVLTPESVGGLPAVDLGTGENEGKLQITYIRRKASSDPGISYLVQFSEALGAWAHNPSATEQVAPVQNTVFERVTVTDSTTEASKRFVRLRVSVL